MATLKDLLQGKSGDEPQVDPQHLAEVQETVNTIVKTLKVFRTYPRENSISIGAVDELTRCLQEHLAKRRTLELFVDRHELQWQGVPVYSESDQRKSLALKLDRDGVRRMVFSGGIDRKEVVSMLEVLSAETDSQSLTDDTVTLLWEKQLQHIRVYVLDEVGQNQESGFDQSLVDASAPSTPGASSQPGEEGTSARTHGSAAAGSPDVFHQELATAAARLSTVCGTTKMKLAPITEHHHQTIRRELQRAYAGRLDLLAGA